MSSNPKGFDPNYDDNKEENIIYANKACSKDDGSTYRKIEVFINEGDTFLTNKNKVQQSQPVEFEIKDKVTLFKSDGGQQKIQCWLVESEHGKSVQAIHISRRNGKGVYGAQEVTLTFGAICALREFLNKLFLIDSPEKIKIPISFPTNTNTPPTIMTENEFVELIRTNIKSTDDFYKLLSIQKMNIAVERLRSILSGEYKNEVSIQNFLKENIWMFGNDYVHIVENGKINAQNILDMIPQDFESYIDIIEVKLPMEKLFRFDESHNNYYATSNLTKAIAQTQNYIFELEKKTLDVSYQKENNCKIIKPKGVILFGSIEPLNDDEKQYLRILNSSYHNLQIITYQQLLEKAQNTLKILKGKHH